MAPTSLEYLTSQLTLVSAMMDLECSDFRVEQQIDYREEGANSTAMAGFAGEAFTGATNMYTLCYLNGKEIN